MNTDTPLTKTHPGFRCRCIQATLVCCLLLGMYAPVPAAEPIAFQYFYDDLGQLSKVIDSAGNELDYTYDAVGNIVQITRGTAPPPGTLAIFGFTPQQGGIGETVTIQGQGFSPTPGADTVQFNGTPATATSATGATLIVTVPDGATTGPISVTVGAATVQSASDFTVIPLPVITSLSRHSALFNTVIPDLTVTGSMLAGATFSFQTSAITITSASISPTGTSADLGLTVGTQPGTFVLVATNSFGSSSPGVTPGNSFTVVSPSATADSDGDGFPDVIEATFGSDPLDPNSVPTILPVPEADSLTFSLLNGTAPPAQPTMLEADSLTVSLLNATTPPPQSTVPEADSLTFSLLNGTTPPAPPTVFETDSLTFSVVNTAP